MVAAWRRGLNVRGDGGIVKRRREGESRRGLKFVNINRVIKGVLFWSNEQLRKLRRGHEDGGGTETDAFTNFRKAAGVRKELEV